MLPRVATPESKYYCCLIAILLSLSQDIRECVGSTCSKQTTGDEVYEECHELVDGGHRCQVKQNLIEADPIEYFDACHINPCVHGGTCLIQVNGRFYCECSPSWTGHICAESKFIF